MPVIAARNEGRRAARMESRSTFALAAALSITIAVAAIAEEPVTKQAVDKLTTGASFYPGFTGYSRKVTTDSPEAQQWFNQGIQLLYGYNHDEAIRSF